jgi:hypothetical protein
MKKYLLLIPLILFFASCVEPEKISGFVYEKYSSMPPISKNTGNDYILINTDKYKKSDTLIRNEVLDSYVFPALIYWEIKNTIRFDLNIKSTVNSFSSSLISYADSINLGEKLNGLRLEISINKIPNGFVFTNKYVFVFLFVAFTYSGYESIMPENESLKISYKLFSDTSVVKSNTFKIGNKEHPIESKKISMKKFIWKYIDYHENCLKKLSKDALDEILKDIGI